MENRLNFFFLLDEADGDDDVTGAVVGTMVVNLFASILMLAAKFAGQLSAEEAAAASNGSPVKPKKKKSLFSRS